VGSALSTSIALDNLGVYLSRQELAARGEEFDLMVVYLAGLDHYLHEVGERCQGGERCADFYFRTTLHKAVNAIVNKMGDLADDTVFGVFSDHGHVQVDRRAFIDLNDAGASPRFLFNSVSMANVLSGGPASNIRVSHVHHQESDDRPAADVIFVPQFGMAQIYVAANAGSGKPPDWTAPPSTETLKEIVRRLDKYYMWPTRRFQNVSGVIDWGQRPFDGILVREPGPTNAPWKGTYKLYAPPTTCGPSECEFALVDVSTMTTLGPDAGTAGEWAYLDAHRRLNLEFSSVNTGDIILLANVREFLGGFFAPLAVGGFQFGKPYSSQHGTLTAADGRVPVAFGTLSATDPEAADDLLSPVRAFFLEPYRREGNSDTTTPKPIEAEAIRRFFSVRTR
jgi:hypothetical protein